MTTYSEEGCPYKGDCPDPDHHHTQSEAFKDDYLSELEPVSRKVAEDRLERLIADEVRKAEERGYKRGYLESDKLWNESHKAAKYQPTSPAELPLTHPTGKESN